MNGVAVRDVELGRDVPPFPPDPRRKLEPRRLAHDGLACSGRGVRGIDVRVVAAPAGPRAHRSYK